MQLITDEMRAQMLAYGRQSNEGDDIDPPPVVKLFTPDGSATWLLTELDPEDHDLAFGLCDLGLGFPEVGYVRLSEITEAKGMIGLPVERDIAFEAKAPLSAYAEVARIKGAIDTAGVSL